MNQVVLLLLLPVSRSHFSRLKKTVQELRSKVKCMPSYAMEPMTVISPGTTARQTSRRLNVNS
jgi:hypothetical protein